MSNKNTQLKSFITKSKSGHYTVTVKEVGTWTHSSGKVFPYSETVFKQGKIELCTAQRLASEFLAGAK